MDGLIESVKVFSSGEGNGMELIWDWSGKEAMEELFSSCSKGGSCGRAGWLWEEEKNKRRGEERRGG